MNAARGSRVAGIGERRIFIAYGALAHTPTAELHTLAAALREYSRRGAAGAGARDLNLRVLAELARRGSGSKPAKRWPE